MIVVAVHITVLFLAVLSLRVVVVFLSKISTVKQKENRNMKQNKQKTLSDYQYTLYSGITCKRLEPHLFQYILLEIWKYKL